MTIDSVKNMKEALCEKLKVSFGSTVEEASDAQMMRASALVLRDVMAERSVDSMRENRAEHRRQVHYLSMEFLMGRSLMKNAFNLGVGEILTEALNELGFHAADIFECEPDAGLGNGGLGRRSTFLPRATPSAMSWVFSASASSTASRSSCRTTGRISAGRGCCRSRRRPKPCALAVRSASSGTAGGCTSCQRVRLRCLPFPVTWRSRAMERIM